MIYKEAANGSRRYFAKEHVYVFAQDVNSATPDVLPEIAATQIGGFMIASGLLITFDPTLPCPLQAQAVVTVAS